MKFYTNIDKIGKYILVREWDGYSHKKYRVEYSPTLFVPTNEDSDIVAFDKVTRLRGKTFETMRDANEFIDMYADESFSIYGTKNYVSQYISEHYKGHIDYDQSHIRCYNFDIETVDETEEFKGFPNPDNAPIPIVSITLFDSISKRYHIWGLKDFSSTEENITYHKCRDEEYLLMHFLEFWEKNPPNVITGWNITGFDIPYVVNRIKNLFGEKIAKRLSPWGILNSRTIKEQYGREIHTYDIVGVSNLDYIELYKKFRLEPRESYKLDYIAYIELNDQKVDYSSEGNLTKLYINNFQKFIEYNIHDVRLIERLDEKLSYLNLIYSLSYYSHQPYTDTFSPVKTWEALIYNYALDNNMRYRINSPGVREKFVGAYVKEPQLGMKKWIVSIDAASLYPSIIRQHNISNEMILEDLPEELLAIRRQIKSVSLDIAIQKLISKEIDLSALQKYGVTLTPNGQFFRIAEQSVNSVMMENLYIERKNLKKQMLEKKVEYETNPTPELYREIATLDSAQHARKILLNSNFGASGNPYYNFYDVRIAEAITTTGQLLNKWLTVKLNKFFNHMCKTKDKDFVIAGDTDSWYLDLEPIVRMHPNIDNLSESDIVDFLDDFMNKIVQPKINAAFDEFLQYTNGRELMIFVDREAIASAGFWTAKKRYALMVHDNEGIRYKTPKLKVMGIEIVKSNTPEWCRNRLEEGVRLMLTKDNQAVLDYIDSVKKDFKKEKIEVIAQPGGIGGMVKYAGEGNELAKKGAQAHVRGALMYNRLIDKYDLFDRSRIHDGDKIKKVFLKTPNPIHQDVIAFPTHENLPEEFGLHSYVDYDVMFDKTFMQPMRGMLNAVNWRHENIASLEDFFT
jgi:DNA polymerase elongation subunit (family B)